MRTIFIGNGTKQSMEMFASLSQAVRQAEISLGHFLLSVNMIIEAVFSREEKMTNDAIQIFEYQIMKMIQKLTEFQKTLLQKRRLLEAYQVDHDKDLNQHIRTAAEDTLNLLSRRNFHNDFYKDRIDLFLYLMVQNAPENKMTYENEENQIHAQSSSSKWHSAKPPWVANGIYSKYKKSYRKGYS